jgi:hypothetical protein
MIGDDIDIDNKSEIRRMVLIALPVRLCSGHSCENVLHMVEIGL